MRIWSLAAAAASEEQFKMSTRERATEERLLVRSVPAHDNENQHQNWKRVGDVAPIYLGAGRNLVSGDDQGGQSPDGGELQPRRKQPSVSSIASTSSSSSSSLSSNSTAVVGEPPLRAFGQRRLTTSGSNDLGNRCGKCQNHDVERSKKGHARDCPFKKCDCLKCRLLDARSDILQVISGKETKLKGTKKDPNCGFCQNHGVKILRKGHVRSCGYGQERHFRMDNCFDCEVHYIRNEVNRLQIKMRRAMKEDRTLSEEQRKTAREAITRDEVEKVCDMARLARRKRGSVISAQHIGGEPSMLDTVSTQPQALFGSPPSQSPSSSAAAGVVVKRERQTTFDGQIRSEQDRPAGAGLTFVNGSGPMMARRIPQHRQQQQQQQQQLNPFTHQQTSAGVWRPWSHQQQIVAAMAAQQQHQIQLQPPQHQPEACPQFITQLQQQQPLLPPPQIIDCTMQRSFGSSAIDSLASLFDGGPSNSALTSRRPLQSMPEESQPINLQCASQQTVSGDSNNNNNHNSPLQSTSSQNGHDLNLNCLIDSQGTESQMDSLENLMHQQQEALEKVVVASEASGVGGQSNDEAPDLELDVMGSPARTLYASTDNSCQSVTPVRVATPTTDPANNINISFNVGRNIYSSHLHNNNYTNPPQEQPLCLVPQFSRAQHEFAEGLLHLILQLSGQNQSAN